MIPLPIIKRKKTCGVMVGTVQIGGGSPIVVQSMTDTDTANASATATQVAALASAGSEIVRITVNNEESAKAVPEIKARLDDMGYGHVPLVGDFHYNGHTLLAQYPRCAEILSKYRVNPGNVGFGYKQDTQFKMIVDKAIEYGKPVRIGVNWGSLDQTLVTALMDENATSSSPVDADSVMRHALVISALQNAQKAMDYGLGEDMITLSCKVSRVQDLVAIYQVLSEQSNFPLHLGLTEAGMGSKGIVASTAALAILLQQGIGDTIRISLTPEPGAPREKEVIVAQEILQTMGLRAFTPLVSSCPGCGRTTSSFFRELAAEIQRYIRQEMPQWKRLYPGVENLSIAVMGCIVNGPGESKHADIGISLPGSGENPVAPVFIDGNKAHTLRGNTIAQEFLKILSSYIHNRFSR